MFHICFLKLNPSVIQLVSISSVHFKKFLVRNSRCAVNATNGTQAMNPFLPVRHSFPVVMRCKEKHPEQTGAACGKSRSSAEARVRGGGWTRPGGGRRAPRGSRLAGQGLRSLHPFAPHREDADSNNPPPWAVTTPGSLGTRQWSANARPSYWTVRCRHLTCHR